MKPYDWAESDDPLLFPRKPELVVNRVCTCNEAWAPGDFVNCAIHGLTRKPLDIVKYGALAEITEIIEPPGQMHIQSDKAVVWKGTISDYLANMPAIHHELAQEFAESTLETPEEGEV